MFIKINCFYSLCLILFFLNISCDDTNPSSSLSLNKQNPVVLGPLPLLVKSESEKAQPSLPRPANNSSIPAEKQKGFPHLPVKENLLLQKSDVAKSLPVKPTNKSVDLPSEPPFWETSESKKEQAPLSQPFTNLIPKRLKQCLITYPRAPSISKNLIFDVKSWQEALKEQAEDLSETTTKEKAEKMRINLIVREMETFPPVKGLRINTTTFLVSRPSCAKRPEAVVYAIDHKGNIYGRLFYRSLSNGIWRTTRYRVQGVYDKGQHYTQDMLPHLELDELLSSKDLTPCIKLDTKQQIRIEDYFDIDYQQEASKFTPKIWSSILRSSEASIWFSYYKNGYGLIDSQLGLREKFFESMSKKNMQKGFYPDFTCHLKEYRRSHSILSREGELLKNNIKVDVFLAKLDNRVVEWHFAYVEGTKKPWVARIRFADAKISTFGTDSDLIDSGSITLKPLEYSSQVSNLILSKDYKFVPNTTYVDIRNFLQNFPPIIDYKKYKDATNSW